MFPILFHRKKKMKKFSSVKSSKAVRNLNIPIESVVVHFIVRVFINNCVHFEGHFMICVRNHLQMNGTLFVEVIFSIAAAAATNMYVLQVETTTTTNKRANKWLKKYKRLLMRERVWAGEYNRWEWLWKRRNKCAWWWRLFFIIAAAVVLVYYLYSCCNWCMQSLLVYIARIHCASLRLQIELCRSNWRTGESHNWCAQCMRIWYQGQRAFSFQWTLYTLFTVYDHHIYF